MDTSWRGALERELDTVDHVFPRDVRAVYLHGSRAEGSALDDSDIDLTVVVTDQPPWQRSIKRSRTAAYRPDSGSMGEDQRRCSA